MAASHQGLLAVGPVNPGRPHRPDYATLTRRNATIEQTKEDGNDCYREAEARDSPAEGQAQEAP